MRAHLSLLGSDILCRRDGTEANTTIRLPLDAVALAKLHDWTQRYRAAVLMNDPSPLHLLGREIFQWLDNAGWASAWAGGGGPCMLEVAVNDPRSEAAGALLDLPWEVLADGRDFLAADAVQPFIVFRSIGRSPEAQPATPAHSDLALMFMAAAPRGQHELNFEREEAGILEATKNLPVQVVVEESGCAEFLKDRLATTGPFEVVHLTCHGDIIGIKGPVLALETPEGELDLVTPGDVAKMLGEQGPLLLFLSACRTAEADADHTATITESFVRALVRAGIPNILGWDGSVYDTDAIGFAEVFYHELAAYQSVPYAAAIARRTLLEKHRDDPKTGRHWHLAHAYAGSYGAGACCGRNGRKRSRRTNAGYAEFLDNDNRRVPVATAEQFVGRRRQTQVILRAVRDGRSSGVLIFGMGNLGKSSLAAHVANRMPAHRTVVVFERYDALAIFEQLVAALPAGERAKWRRDWLEHIAADGASLADALEGMLTGPFEEHPILLVIDDLERILEDPAPGQTITPVRDADGTPDTWRRALGAVLRAFDAAETASRLLLTSRYDFTLPDGRSRDLAAPLVRIQLLPMEPRERAKQWRAAERTAEHIDSLRDQDLAARALHAAGGNPGLQEILCRPILAGEAAAAESAIDAVERFKASGDVPSDENAAQEFFRRVSFETYRNALTDQELAQLRASTLFSEGMPIPRAALEAAGRAADVGQPGQCIARLIGLGLVDDWGVVDAVGHAAVNPLARPLAGATLNEEEQRTLATTAFGALAEVWRDGDGDFPFDPRGVEAARLALLADASTELLSAAAFAGGSYLFLHEHDAASALQILVPAAEQIESLDSERRIDVLILTSQCAELVGKIDLQISMLETGLTLSASNETSLAHFAVLHAEATAQVSSPEATLSTLRNAVAYFERIGDVRSRAVTVGQIANILMLRGETEEALRIIHDEELPVYERIGDVRSRAVAMGRIADILRQRGDTDEALRILQEEELPVYERLDDIRSRAVTMGKIADILLRRGEPDEALRILREEALPVYERLGDLYSRAVTMAKIAGVLLQRGETDEALRIMREEALPVFERLGDVRSRAVAMGKIADILIQRGETDEALRIRQEEELPVYDKLGDVRSRVVTMSKIADILQQRGETDEALRIRREEELPVYERLGDVRLSTMTTGKIADDLYVHGQIEEALRIWAEECLPAARTIDDANMAAQLLARCAMVRLELDERQSGDRKAIIHELIECFILFRSLESWENVAYIGAQLGQVLAAVGQTDDAMNVLEQSAAYEHLDQTEEAAHMRELLKQIRDEQS